MDDILVIKKKIPVKKLPGVENYVPPQEPAPAPEEVPVAESISWEAPEYDFKQKSVDWFWAIGIVALASSFASFWINNFLLGVICLLGGFSIMIYGARKPDTVKINISEKGVQINKELYKIDNLSAFQIKDIADKEYLVIQLKKSFNSYLPLLTNNTDSEKIRNTLSLWVEEKEIEEPFSSILFRLIGI